MTNVINTETQRKLDAVRTQPQTQVDAWVAWTTLVNEARSAGMTPEDVRRALWIMAVDNEA